MRTLLVGDTHLKNRVILPIVQEKAQQLNCQQLILMGDYVDEWHQEQNSQLYRQELSFLLNWKQTMMAAGFAVTTLLGNHDGSYLTRTPRLYLLQKHTDFEFVRSQLLQLGLQVAVKSAGFLISHAGLCWGNDLDERYFQVLTEEDLLLVKALEDRVGTARGGRYWNGSPLWADYWQELRDAPNPKYLQQIVGHTTVTSIINEPGRPDSLIAIDTFSINGNHLNNSFGDGSLLLLDQGVPKVIPTNWATSPQVQTYLRHEIFQH